VNQIGVSGEKRKEHRIKLDIPITVQSKAGLSKAKLIDISVGGCQIVGTFESRVGEILTVFLDPKYQTSVPDFQAKMVWKELGSDSTGFRFGGSFWAIKENQKTRIVRQILSKALTLVEVHLKDKIEKDEEETQPSRRMTSKYP